MTTVYYVVKILRNIGVVTSNKAEAKLLDSLEVRALRIYPD